MPDGAAAGPIGGPTRAGAGGPRRGRLLRVLPTLVGLTLRAYWDRIKRGRSPFAPTLGIERRTLPKATGRRSPSDEPWLRPVPHCDCADPAIVALAERFRAETETDWDYAATIYDFCRNEIAYALETPSRRGVVGTLERGCGNCHEKSAVLAALARAGGIPTRFCRIAVTAGSQTLGDMPFTRVLAPIVESWGESRDRRVKKLGDAVAPLMRRLTGRAARRDSFQSHPVVEMRIGDHWIPVDPVFGDAAALGLGFPLPRFGFDPITLKGGLVATLADRSEGLPPDYRPLRRTLISIFGRGVYDLVNRHIEARREEGRARLAGLDRAEYMKRMRHFYVPVPGSASAEPVL